ncbi:MAG: HAMP domain-containing histidine kinase [Elusimicrobia bacterium]|nr:HAMP domain-containing histidine kinase [Elusimicrobiota bacterium]MDE2237362.1 HAMP domain-containing histidine kinase [Elusimicrobiota bacterium]MDE2426094.1 HAMP domain-containing histidine kinase [Elusimicrobiota bacterium]
MIALLLLLGLSRSYAAEPRASVEPPQAILALSAPPAPEALDPDIAGHLAHDLRAPLTAIYGYAQLLKLPQDHPLLGLARQMKATVGALDGDGAQFHQARGPLLSQLLGMSLQLQALSRQFDGNSQGSDMLVSMRRSVESGLGIVHDYSELLSGRDGSLSLSRTKPSANDLLKKAMEPFEDRAKQKNITFHLETAEGFPNVLGNKPALMIALKNLVDNATKYTPEGGTVTLKASRSDGGVLFEIIDSGIGIPKEDMKNIFTGSYRTQAAQAMAQGTGKGLRRVRQLIEASGGELHVESEPNKGSRFYFTLPAAH